MLSLQLEQYADGTLHLELRNTTTQPIRIDMLHDPVFEGTFTLSQAGAVPFVAYAKDFLILVVLTAPVRSRQTLPPDESIFYRIPAENLIVPFPESTPLTDKPMRMYATMYLQQLDLRSNVINFKHSDRISWGSNWQFLKDMSPSFQSMPEQLNKAARGNQ